MLKKIIIKKNFLIVYIRPLPKNSGSLLEASCFHMYYLTYPYLTV